MHRFGIPCGRGSVADGATIFALKASFGPALAWGPAIAMILLAAGVASASERGHTAHVHGVSRLNLAVDGNHVALEVEAPGADIVGFEHTAESDADQAAISRAAGILKAGDALFRFPASAKCRLLTAEVEPPETAREHPHREAHGGKAKEAAPAEKRHSEFHARYEFRCDQPASLTEVDAGNFFKRFSAAREIEARAVTARGQRARELTPAASKLAF